MMGLLFREETLSEEACKFYFIELVHAVRAVHKASYIHR